MLLRVFFFLLCSFDVHCKKLSAFLICIISNQSVVLLGTRFRPLSFEVPKPLFPVAGVPILQHHIEACAKVSITAISYIVQSSINI